MRPYSLHGWWSHLAWQWLTCLLLTEQSVYTMRSCGLLFFEWEAWSLTSFCLLAILDNVLPSFLAGMSHTDAGIGLGTIPTPWFAWTLSASIPAVMSPLLDPSKTCPVPVCNPLYLSRFFHAVGCRDFWRHLSMLWLVALSVWFALLVGGLAWTSWSQWACPRWFPEWKRAVSLTLSPLKSCIFLLLLLYIFILTGDYSGMRRETYCEREREREKRGVA